MPNIVRRRDKRGKVYFWNKKTKKFSNEASYKRSRKSYAKSSGSRKKSKKMGGRKMAKRGNGSSYSKQNIAIGTLLSQVAPKVLPQVAGFLPLVAVLPKAPVALKVMGWGMASKVVSDSFLNR